MIKAIIFDVGDAETDMNAARAANMKFLLYSKGSLKGSDARTSDFRAIPELIKTL
jgi:histidinol phosphatase-like enzyme